MNRRSICNLLPAAAAAMAVALMASTAAQAQVKLRYAHVGVANAPQTLYADEVAKLVKERTNGRVEITVFANSQLGGVGEMVDGVKSGAISIGHHDFASLGKILPTTAVFNTPFVYRDAEHSLRATDARNSPALREINHRLGLGRTQAMDAYADSRDYWTDDTDAPALMDLLMKSPLWNLAQAGVGVAGLFTRDVAETKVKATQQLAEQHEFPLLVTLEPDPEGARA